MWKRLRETEIGKQIQKKDERDREQEKGSERERDCKPL